MQNKMVDKTFEFTNEEISTLGLIIIALVSMIHITMISLYVVIPVISILIFNLLSKYIKGFKK